MNTRTGTVLWSADVGGAMVRSFQAVEDAVDSGVVIPGADGSIFVFSEGELKRFPMTVPDFVQQSPMFQVLASGRRLTIVGSKTDRVFQIDPATGKVLRSFSSSPHDEAEGDNQDVLEPNMIVVNRHDYRVRAFDELSGKEVWNFTYAVVNPMPANKVLDPTLKVSNERGVQSFRSNALMNRVKTLWNRPDPVTAVAAVFDENSFVVVKSKASDALALAPGSSGSGTFAGSAFVNSMTLPSGEVQLFVGSEAAGSKSAAANIAVDKTKALVLASPSVACGADDSASSCFVVPRGEHPVVFLELSEAARGGVVPINDSASSSRTTRRLVSSTVMSVLVLLLPILTLVYYKFIYNAKSLQQRKKKSKKKSSRKSLSSTMATAEDGKQDEYEDDEEDDVVEPPPSETLILREDESGKRVGKLLINMDKIKGFGGNGTIVVEGNFDGRAVAVKRMQSALYDRANKEIDLLIQSEGHMNVVRYLAKEETVDFVYLALELCDMTLEQAMENKQHEGDWISDDSRKFLYELSSATHHLHVHGIVHCDIKPQNVLVVPRHKNLPSTQSTSFGARWMPKLSDMGLSRTVDVEQSSFRVVRHVSAANESNKSSHVVGGGGTVGWRAPELLTRSSASPNDHRLSRKVDVFSLGCVFFYFIEHVHPFGEWLHRESHIVLGKPVVLDKLKRTFGGGGSDAYHLIADMIAFNPTDRPSMAACLAHPLLWDAKTRLEFLCDVSNRVEREDSHTDALRKLEILAPMVFAENWVVSLDPVLKNDVANSKYRKYDSRDLRDLLRYVRNKRHHWDEDAGLKLVLSWEAETFLKKFCPSFPDLIPRVFEWSLMHCSSEPKFLEWFGGRFIVEERQSKVWTSVAPNGGGGACNELGNKIRHRGWFPEDWPSCTAAVSVVNPIQHPPSMNWKSNLCLHWERSGGSFCVMGPKCGFAHSLVELRVVPELASYSPVVKKGAGGKVSNGPFKNVGFSKS